MATDTVLTREGAVNSLKLLMIVLAAMLFWQAAVGLNGELRAQELVSVDSLLARLSRVLGGPDPAPVRLSAFWEANHRLLAMTAMLIAGLLLVARFLALGRIIDYLYIESEVRQKRIYSGFVASILLVLGHAGAIYAMIFLSRGAQAELAPVALLAMLALNLLWFVGVLFSTRRQERFTMRGVRYLTATALLTALGLAIAVWRIEDRATAVSVKSGSVRILVSCGFAGLLCLVDGIIQGKVYRLARAAKKAA